MIAWLNTDTEQQAYNLPGSGYYGVKKWLHI